MLHDLGTCTLILKQVQSWFVEQWVESNVNETLKFAKEKYEDPMVALELNRVFHNIIEEAVEGSPLNLHQSPVQLKEADKGSSRWILHRLS